MIELKDVKESKMLKPIDVNYPQLKDASTIEEVLCLSALIAADRISDSATIQEARNYFDSIGTCDSCPITERCLACKINA
jgi:hypothetical protein